MLILLNLLKLFYGLTWSLWRMFHIHLRRICNLFKCSVNACSLGLAVLLCCSNLISVLVVSIIEHWIYEVSNCYCWNISSFDSVICFMYFGTLLLYMFIMKPPWCFNIKKCPLFLVTIFVLRSDINMVTPALFL